MEIDPGRASVTRAGEPVYLRAKAFLVLLYLLKQRHRVVSKEELFQQIWPDTNVVDATLGGCILEIRKALADDTKDPKFIKTLPRMGYRFIAPVEEVEECDVVPPAESPKPEMPRRRPARWWILSIATLILLVGLGAVRVLSFRTPSSSADADSSEAAWWKLDEAEGTTVSDSSGHGLHGRTTGGAWRPGVQGRALYLDGADHRATGLDALNILPRGDSPRSLAAWVKTESPNGDTTTIVHYGSVAPLVLDSFRLSLLPDGRPVFACCAGNEQSMAVARKPVDDGRWHYLVGTFEHNRGVLFIDGVQDASATMLSETKVSSVRHTPWAIGNSLQKHTGFRGAVDDVRIFRRALRAADAMALYRCTSGITDLIRRDAPYFYFPIADNLGDTPTSTVTLVDSHSSGESTALVQHGLDYGGIQLAKRRDDCSMRSLRGADMGQDLTISVELLVPSVEGGIETEAGPYFRSRRAGPGDGIIGGASAGYWVQLHNNGAVTVKRLNPSSTVAFTRPIPGFRSNEFHKLEVAVKGETFEAALDGGRLTFDQQGRLIATVMIQPAWDGPPRVGDNDGAAGVAFASEPFRHRGGGQQARRLSLEPYRRLGAK